MLSLSRFASMYRQRLIVTRPAAAGYSGHFLDFGGPVGLVVFAFNSHLLSGLVIPIHFFLALFLKQLVS